MKKFILAMLVIAGAIAYPQASLQVAASESAQIIEMTSANKDAILNSGASVVIKVYAPWCGPCKSMNPIYDQIANELGNKYMFTTLNGDNHQDLVRAFGINGYPTVLFYQNGVEVGRSVGFQNYNQLVSKMTSVFSN